MKAILSLIISAGAGEFLHARRLPRRAACRAAPPAAPRRLTQLTAHWHRPSNPSARTAGATELGAHAGFPVIPRAEAPASYTYMSVRDPEAKNLDGSVYGIAVCLSTVSKANWTFSADGGGWCYDELEFVSRASRAAPQAQPLQPATQPRPHNSGATSARRRRSAPTRRGRARPRQWAATRRAR